MGEGRGQDAGSRETRDETRTREGKVWIGTDLREYARGTKRSLASNQPKGANDRREKNCGKREFWRTDLYPSLPARQTARFGSTLDLLDEEDGVSAMTIIKFPYPSVAGKAKR